MRRIILFVLITVLVLAVAIPAIAHPMSVDKGKGCGCHRTADKPMGSIHTGYLKSDGMNGGAAACLRCHA